MKVKLSDIIDAMDVTDSYTENFLDAQTGKIEFINDMVMGQEEKEEIYDRLDEHGFYRLPTSFDIRDYDIMEDFIAGMPEGVQGRMYDAIQGRGAFRRFKDMINAMGIEKSWYDFHDDVYRQKAAQWCEENDIEYE
jgi:hypothetical protein